MVAAGSGVRAGGGVPKQFREVGGVPVVLRALRPFLAHPQVRDLVLVLPPPVVASLPSWLAPLVGERLRVAAGGGERMDSVEAGLRELGPEVTLVLVHDGARPFPDRDVIDGVLAAARRGVGAVAAVPVSDTLKEAAPGGDPTCPRVARTVARTALWRAQTPQGFPRGMLEAALARARATGAVATDDAELVEALGETVVLVPDSLQNLKLTSAEDFRLAEVLAGLGGT